MSQLGRDGEKWQKLMRDLRRLELVRGQDGWGRDIQLAVDVTAQYGAYVLYDELALGVAKIRDEADQPLAGRLSAHEKEVLRIRALNCLVPGDWLGCKASEVIAILDELESRP